MGGSTTVTTTTTTQEVEFVNTLEDPSKEFDYIEDIKIDSVADPFMRVKNVYFAANGLKPTTKHYHYLDNGVPDIVPKQFEISMSNEFFHNI